MSRKLLLIKLIHTVIWIFFVLLIFYILFSGIFNRINFYTFVSIGIIAIEGIILVSFGWKCPLTVVGEKYSTDHDIGFDIFIPKWIIKNNTAIFGTLFVLGTLIVNLRLFNIF